VSYVVDLREARLLENVVDNCRSIMGSHLFPAELPECLIFSGQALMALGEAVTSVVTKPYVVARSGQDEGRGYFRPVVHPLHHVSLEAVLEQYGRLGLFARSIVRELSWDPPDPQDIPVVGDDLVLFNSEAILVGHLLQGFESIRVSEQTLISSLSEVLQLLSEIYCFGCG